ncbi:DUF2917 domain-containing protein [Roseateles oligotrophus]|uniref:DUF2917 domain-containing protein n=1 Tax=Roseateles oligotrophus TaxID=1769250 RepID=A0ABT2YHP8_9BURK|nr:DUF2917 domain-containing protein [Roseateles oligotrophus]MCV2369553.1 DUF2917 domain-containing protein [Roseateles oligotrophus]
MSHSQALWALAQGEALSLEIGPGPRELVVTKGRVWLTQQGSASAPPEDVWLEAGQSLALASGSRVVMEAWPQADFQLLVPPAACRARSGRQLAKPIKPVLAKAFGLAC